MWNSFGRGAARGGVDDRLTSNDEVTHERMMKRREGAIGPEDVRATKRMGEKYPGPGYEAIKSSVSTAKF